jgi:uncharacterized protein YkwD
LVTSLSSGPRALSTLRFRIGLALVSAGVAISALVTPIGALAPRVAHAEAVAAPEYAASLEAQLFDLLNADRVANNLAPLNYDESLASVARWRSDDMAVRDYFSHDIGGYQVFSVLKDSGIAYRVAGENLAFNYQAADTSASAAEQALMNSPTHRANILRSDFTHAGIGVSVAPDGKVLYTQLFKRAW